MKNIRTLQALIISVLILYLFYSCKTFLKKVKDDQGYQITWGCVDYIKSNLDFIPVVNIKVNNSTNDTLVLLKKQHPICKQNLYRSNFEVYRERDTLQLNCNLQETSNELKVLPRKEVILEMRLGYISSPRNNYIDTLSQKSYFNLIDSILMEGQLYYNPPECNLQRARVILIDKTKIKATRYNCSYENNLRQKKTEKDYPSF